MNVLLIVMIAAAAVWALGQRTLAAGPAEKETQSAASVPSGVWRRGGLPWYEPPALGPGPVTNRSRRNGVSNYDQFVGDYTNPILQPWAAEVVKKCGEISLKGITYPNPANQCWPEPVPFIFKHMGMAVLQQPHQITFLFNEDHEVRQVPIDASHLAQEKPCWHGNSVGHWDGNTLVIDTIGVKTDRPYAMIDLFGTPYTKDLHVVERYSLLDRESAKDALERGLKENQQQGLQEHVDCQETVDMAEVAARMAESLVDFVLRAPEEQQAQLLAATIAYVGQAFLEKTGAIAGEGNTVQ
jgi:hypothetical protein